MVLRDLLPKRPADRPLKVVLMSATLDASLFHDYFWGAPSVKFPGRTYPVVELYLEDIVEVTGKFLCDVCSVHIICTQIDTLFSLDLSSHMYIFSYLLLHRTCC